MKRAICICLTFMLAMGLVACGEKSSKQIDLEDYANYIMKNIQFDDEMTKIEDNMALMLYDVPEGTDFQVCIGSGATSEEFAVFRATDEDAANIIKSNIREHIDTRINDFQDYMPGEVDKLKNAIIYQSGNYITVIVANDPMAKSTVEEYFK